ncbi:MAG: glycoside hydrolase family 97 catalytic domain-containing protein, partial [Phycisphaerae bacterium]|nr:glycoside hydrolase family 97 catalytic domain-containing protein [Phycisphaerae bacterium]
IRTDWLKPGRCLWQWWAYNDPGTHWSKQKWFVDKAAELNCQYYLVDEGWEHTRQEWATDGHDVWSRMKELCDYAASKGVGIWVWRGWQYDEKRQLPGLETPEKREDFFHRCAEVGIKGTKIDFMNSESHDRLAFYEACLRTAAKYKIMVNFHGANKPAGEARTWPHEMTREGIKGLEHNKWSTLPPHHYASLPFTRYLAGHGDFTPTTFQPKFLKGTTVAQQLACAVVCTSPILCWADKPDVYLESPVVDVIRTMPCVWDETRVLDGSKIGDLAMFARRSGKDWYVGILNGAGARELTLDCAFLGNGEYVADFFGDVANDPTQFSIEREVKINASTHRPVRLNAGGGLVAVIRAR